MSARPLLLSCLAATAIAAGFGCARAQAATRCPAREPQPAIPATKGPRALVRPGATSLLLCRYQALNPRASALRLRSSRLITQRDEIASIVTDVNGLPAARGGFHCPMDDGSAILARFDYPSRAVTSVRIGLTGCRTVAGAYRPLRTAAGPGGARLIAELERLLR